MKFRGTLSLMGLRSKVLAWAAGTRSSIQNGTCLMMTCVELSGSYPSSRQFIRQNDGRFSVNGIATSSWASM